MKLARMPDGSPEIFFTLQGEGRNTGKPAVFLRASLCNLHCVWCDTPYTWNWDDTSHAHESGEKFRREEQILDLTIEEIATRLSRFPCDHYVLTGGEPLLQEKAWVELMETVSGSYEIETNGTLLPGPEFLDRISQLNVSPKLRNSGVAEETRIRPGVLRALAASGKADFKFVVASPGDFKEVTDLVATCDLPPDRIFLMAKARDTMELDANQALVASLAQEHGFRYSDRLHLRLFGAKRGV